MSIRLSLPSQVGGVAHLLVEGDDEHDEQVAEETDEDDDGEEDGHCRSNQAENLFMGWESQGKLTFLILATTLIYGHTTGASPTKHATMVATTNYTTFT